MTLGNSRRRVNPWRRFQSDGLMPEVTIRTRTSPGPGVGSGSSPMWSTSAAPLRSYHIAFIVAPPVMLGGRLSLARGVILAGPLDGTSPPRHQGVSTLRRPAVGRRGAEH